MRANRVAAHGLALAVVATVGTLAWWRATRVWPFGVDNLVSFTFALDKPTFLYQESSGSGGYRPLGILTIWLQNLVVGIRPRTYLVLNLGLWIATAGALYALAWRLTRAIPLATAAALALVVDGRVHSALIQVVDRQNTIAVLFGVSALLLVMGRGDEAVSRGRAWGAFGLLAAAALSKEPALSFAVAVAAWAALRRPEGARRLLAACAGAVGLYFVLRLAFVQSHTFCETMGLWRHTRDVCFGPGDGHAVSLTGLDRIGQQAYNAGAMLVGTFLPFLFDNVGTLRDQLPNPGTVVFFTATSALAITGWIARPRLTLPLLALVVANAALGLLLYRTRNQLIGMVGVYATAAVGAQWALARIARVELRRAVAVGAALALCAWALTEARLRADDMREEVDSSIQSAHGGEPCTRVDDKRVRGTAYVSRDAMRRLRLHYGLPDPDCRHVIEGILAG